MTCCAVHLRPGASQVALVVKNLPANAEDARDVASIPGSGGSPGGGHGHALQYSCLENPMDRGAWRATSMGSQRVRYNLSDLACTHTSETITLVFDYSPI